ncbi:MAG TPA: tetratricopeptide repeat protein [Gemmatimonadaceae bacterium]|nr:tetratricopeptide repeat protein [Gemmatimonadaceae bacterium]
MDFGSDLIADGVRAERAGALDRALESYQSVAASATDPSVIAEALTREADVHRARCDWDAALAAARRAQETAEKANLSQRLAEAVNAEANVLMCTGDFIGASTKYELIAAKSVDPRLCGIAMQNLGSIYAQCGQPKAAERAFTESLSSFRKADYKRGQAIALNNLGRLALDSNDCAHARLLLESALNLARQEEDHDLAALASLNLAGAHCVEGALDRAQDLAMAAMGYFSDCANRFREIECLRLIGDINLQLEDRPNAERCYRLALNLAEQIGSEPELKLTMDKLSALSQPPVAS